MDVRAERYGHVKYTRRIQPGSLDREKETVLKHSENAGDSFRTCRKKHTILLTTRRGWIGGTSVSAGATLDVRFALFRACYYKTTSSASAQTQLLTPGVPAAVSCSMLPSRADNIGHSCDVQWPMWPIVIHVVDDPSVRYTELFVNTQSLVGPNSRDY